MGIGLRSNLPTEDVVFCDHRERLDRDGFTVIRQALSESDISELHEEFAKQKADFQSRFERGASFETVQHFELHRPSLKSAKIRTSPAFRKLKNIASTLTLGRANYTFDHVIWKKPLCEVETCWHQDQGYLGEHIYLNSLHFWVPLCDADEYNGALAYVPGSHKAGLLKHIRSMKGHREQRHIEQAPSNYVTPKFRIGDVSCHTPMVIHGAGKNQSNAPRIAWGIHFSKLGMFGYLAPANLVGVSKRLLRGEFS